MSTTKLTVKEAANTVNQAAEAGARELDAVVAAIQAGNLDDAAHHAKYVRANLSDISKITSGTSKNWTEASAAFAAL